MYSPTLNRLTSTGKSVDPDHAAGIQPDLVGQRGQVILLLAQAVRQGHHRLAGRFEIGDGGFQLLQGGQPDAPKVAGIDHQPFDAGGVFGQPHGPHQVAQAGFAAGTIRGLLQRTIHRRSAVLFHNLAVGPQYQRGVGLHDQGLAAVDPGHHEQVQNRQKNEIQDDLACPVDEMPDAGEEPHQD